MEINNFTGNKHIQRNKIELTTNEHVCYCLWSTTMKHRVYTGYTKNFKRRLRQHNTSSKGAKHTHKGRPYLPLFIVHGFKGRKGAMQFERSMKKRRSGKYTYGAMGRISTLLHNLRNDIWRSSNLSVVCLFKRKFLDQVIQKGDENIIKNFIWKPINR